jgi:hypothetical protein
MRARAAWGTGGVLLVLAARLAVPAAPPIYDSIPIPVEPYHYCNPPRNLAAGNKQPPDGKATLQASGNSSALGSVQTGDSQVLAFFPKGALQAAAATSYKIALEPNCQPPSPPPKNKIVGNAYDLVVLGEPGDLPVQFLMQSQVLVRTPPVPYTSVQLYFGGSWQPSHWSQQGDIANVTIEHPGTLGVLDDGSGNAVRTPPGPRAPWIFTVVEILLLAAAIGIVVTAIAVQQRRGTSQPPPSRAS